MPIGENVYGSEASAMSTGDLNGDGYPELIMSDGIYINQCTGTNLRAVQAQMYTANPQITFPGITSWKTLYIADMDNHNTYPDLIGVDHTGRSYMIRSSVTPVDMTTTFRVRLEHGRADGQAAHPRQLHGRVLQEQSGLHVLARTRLPVLR